MVIRINFTELSNVPLSVFLRHIQIGLILPLGAYIIPPSWPYGRVVRRVVDELPVP